MEYRFTGLTAGSAHYRSFWRWFKASNSASNLRLHRCSSCCWWLRWWCHSDKRQPLSTVNGHRSSNADWRLTTKHWPTHTHTLSSHNQSPRLPWLAGASTSVSMETFEDGQMPNPNVSTHTYTLINYEAATVNINKSVVSLAGTASSHMPLSAIYPHRGRIDYNDTRTMHWEIYYVRYTRSLVICTRRQPVAHQILQTVLAEKDWYLGISVPETIKICQTRQLDRSGENDLRTMAV